MLVSLIFFDWVFDSQWASFAGGGRARGGIGSLSFPALLIFAVLLPVVAEIAKNIFAVLLASRDAFDDMIDGLTFGVAAGTAYAAFETIVVYSSVFTSQDFRTTSGIASWMVVVLNVMVVKSLIYGTATGIAVAAFSGKGEGYDGFTPAYFANFGLAVVANVAYWLGVRLMAFLPFGNALGLIWGFLILAALIIKIRMMLQAALLEAAIEAAAKGDGSEDKRSTFVETFCPECENMLLPNASFCVACGTSVRASSGQARSSMGVGSTPTAQRRRGVRHDRQADGPADQPPTSSRPSPTARRAPPAAPAKQVASSEEYFNSSRLKVIGMITAATVAVGALGGIAGCGLRSRPGQAGQRRPARRRQHSARPRRGGPGLAGQLRGRPCPRGPRGLPGDAGIPVDHQPEPGVDRVAEQRRLLHLADTHRTTEPDPHQRWRQHRRPGGDVRQRGPALRPAGVAGRPRRGHADLHERRRPAASVSRSATRTTRPRRRVT